MGTQGSRAMRILAIRGCNLASLAGERAIDLVRGVCEGVALGDGFSCGVPTWVQLGAGR